MATHRYSIDTHPKRTQIINALAKGELSFRDIAKKFNLTKTTLHTYMKNALIPRAAEIKAQELKTGEDLLTELENIKAKAYKMLDACDVYLEDPENPGKYYLGPQAHEIRITYKEPIEGDNGKTIWITKKADLQELINLHVAGMEVTNILIKHADPRKLLLEATKQLYGAVELTGEIISKIKSRNINMINAPVFIELQQILLTVVSKYPDIRREIATGIAKLGEKSG